jgi:hypothetical protein
MDLQEKGWEDVYFNHKSPVTLVLRLWVLQHAGKFTISL